MTTLQITYKQGWYPGEKDELGAYRWMGGESVCFLSNYQVSGKKYLRITAGHSFPEQNLPCLEVFVNGHKIGETEVESAFCAYTFSFQQSGDLEFEFKLDHVFHVPGDERDLGIMIRDIKVMTPSEIGVFLDGWYLEESSLSGVLSRWMKKEAKCLFSDVTEEGEKYIKIIGGHPYFGAENPILSMFVGEEKKGEIEVLPGDRRYILPLKIASPEFQVDFKLDRVFNRQISQDERCLGALVSSVEVFSPQKGQLIYGNGWYAEEKDESGNYSWMGEKSDCFVRDYPVPGRKYLRLTAGHLFPEDKFPKLKVSVNDREIGETEVESAFCAYTFSFEAAGDLKFDFLLDQVSHIPDDERDLGIMVRNIEVLTPSEMGVYLDGWYLEDPSDSGKPSRWMKKEASCLFSDVSGEGERFIKIVGGHPYNKAKNPVLSIFVEGKKKGEMEISPGENSYIFPLKATSREFQLDLKLDNTFDPQLTQDGRQLGMSIMSVEVFSAEKGQLVYGNGWNAWEYDEFFPFHWMSEKSEIYLPSEEWKNKKYLSFSIFSEFADFSQKLNLSLDGEALIEIPLLQRWNFYSFEIHQAKPKGEDIPRETRSHRIDFSVNKVFPERYHREDSRELGIRVSQMEFHNDDETHQNFLFFHSNALLNFKEMQEGITKLKSFPLNLGIDLYGKCNIKPPCVYCLWDSMKELEGEYADANVDERTLEDYGSFFRSTRTLVNCSFGEPLLHPRLDMILEFCAQHKKILELSTNGQALTERAINALKGKPIFLYISLDAARKETYAKIRNDKWDSIVPNLILLSQERKKNNNLPKIYMVFMPMKVNKGDLEDYFRLCRKIDADALVLRPLLYLWNPKIEIDRGGYHFNYKDELLSRVEIEKIILKCDELSEKFNIPVANQFTFGMIQEPGSEKGGSSTLETTRF